jgi:hypothetical protein
MLPDSSVPPASSEPVICFGYPQGGDLVLIQHDGHGRARVGIEHYGSPVVFSAWQEATALTAQPWQVIINAQRLTARAGGLELHHPVPPSVPTAKAVIAANPYGFTSALPAAVLRIERLRKQTKLPLTQPAGDP